MTDWDKLNLRSAANEEAEPAFVKFFWDRFANNANPPRGSFIDIGCGRTARNTRTVLNWGFPCVAIDSSPVCLAHFHGDWHNARTDLKFACVMDIKTLCHDPDPDYQKIYDWLAPGGFLFCMTPTDDHLSVGDAFDVGAGKDFTRMATEQEMRDLLKMFDFISIRKEVRTVTRTKSLYSWVIEAQK